MRSLLADLHWRGLIAQTSDAAGLDAHLASASRVIYCGFDPTADSLHVGNLVPLLALRRVQCAGHKPILLVGGATGLIGDPGGKSAERPLIGPDQVAAWAAKIRAQASRFLDFEGGCQAAVVDNLEWTEGLNVTTFLRDIGKHFSVNAMVQRDSVKSRLERDDAGISYTEFSYMVLQAMDFMELAKRHRCSVQLGGSDQWGNIVGGIELIRRTLGRATYGLTTPLVTRADGRKFGKSEAGAVWLDGAKTSPYAFYQFWLNTADADATDYLKRFTFLDAAAIDALATVSAAEPAGRASQRCLAEETTRLVHGDAGLAAAQRITEALFSGEPAALTAADFEQLRQDGMVSAPVPPGTALIGVLAETGLAASRGAARRLVEGRGVRVNGRIVEDLEHSLTPAAALHGRYHLIRRGRKAWGLAVHPGPG